MFRTPALFVAVDAFPLDARDRGMSAAAVRRVVQDFQAVGYRPIAVAGANANISPSRLAILLGDPESPTLRLETPSDPRPLWTGAHCYNVDLRTSILLTERQLHAAACRTAGLKHVGTLEDLGWSYIAA